MFHRGLLVTTAHAGDLLAHLQQIPDPRGARGRRHSLEAMLASVVCAGSGDPKKVSAEKGVRYRF